MKTETQPITGLFKYFPADKLVFFENRLVLLTPPKYLNDPWDFLQKGRILTDQEVEKECQKFEKDMVEGKPVSAELAQLRPEERWQRFCLAGKSQDFVEKFPNYSKEKISQTHGIVSFTEKPSCRLMWAHYAGSHTGFVAEFAATQHFVEPKEELICCSCMDFPVAKVKYPPIFKWHPWTSDNIVNQSWSKHPVWKYEQEWRILLPLTESVGCCLVAEKNNSPERSCLPFSPEHLTRVIFGMKMKKEMQQQLHLMLNRDEFKHVQKLTTDIDNETGNLILKPYL